MRKTNEAQLPLLDLPPSTKRRATRTRQQPMPAALIARHCNALLAELDRIALDEDARAVRLAQLFTAVERAHESRSTESRSTESRLQESASA